MPASTRLRRTSCERRPCFVALRRAEAFPSGVFGPVLLRAFCLLAWFCFLLIMLAPFHSLCVNNIKEIVPRRGWIPKRKALGDECGPLGRSGIEATY